MEKSHRHRRKPTGLSRTQIEDICIELKGKYSFGHDDIIKTVEPINLCFPLYKAECLNAPASYHILGSNNVLSHVWCQAIIRTTADLLQLGLQNSTIFIQEPIFENVFCKMTTILIWPQCVNWNTTWILFSIFLRLLILMECATNFSSLKCWNAN